MKPEDTVVDLGCGPGLYSSELARQGLKVTGIDLSENSIRYAKEHQPEQNIQYIRESYLNPFGREQFNAALLIYEDYGVLNPENRIILLKNIHDALMPGGHFAFDLCSLAALEKRKIASKPNWYIADSGFWRPHRHVVLEKTFFYEDIPVTCDFYAVLDSKLSIYRVWQTFFTPEAITQELEENGFRVERILSDLTGEPFQSDSPAFGVLCKKI
ncbi:MAG: methyltransferase domain-containing protein [Clostridiaceae bacterium]|nr:methyltransferase domain-containing protein [Clostridiaceae bacterium]